ncbi:MAG TPA: FAD-binding protein [Thiotrichales bacterium]|nr:FAD-binding protein [Thiotrichales bacterium]
MLAELRQWLPAETLVTHPQELRAYECDGLPAYRRVPGAVVIPTTEDQVKRILAAAHRHRVPVVARGAGTGLSGGALPDPDGIVLSMARFNRILSIDPVNRIARVQPGVRNLAISEAAAPHGLYYAPDPSSQIACSIGGNVAENAGGVHCLKYGLTVHNVQGLRVVTPDGETLMLGGEALDTPGYDLLALLHGSEGMLGVIVEITVKLLPRPEDVAVLLAAFAALPAAADAVAGIIGAGIVPAGLEMMDNPAIRAAEDFVHAGYPVDAAAILLVELDGTTESVEAQARRVRELLQRHGATRVDTARDPQTRARFWAGRKSAFPAVGRISPDYYCMDGTIPRRRLAEVLQGIARLSREFGLAVVNVFHAGDGNLHPLILYDAAKPGELERAERFGTRILELCVQAGGTITGEHGVGVEKLDAMCVQFAPAELERFHAVKQVFDPEGLLNPGKAVPSLHRCAELGAMHVHGGALPHPELPRF